jgi:hypothetical protein
MGSRSSPKEDIRRPVALARVCTLGVDEHLKQKPVRFGAGHSLILNCYFFWLVLLNIQKSRSSVEQKVERPVALVCIRTLL